MAAWGDVPLFWGIGDVVVKLRVQKNWNAGDLAREADVEANTITRLEKGGNPHPATLLKISAALGVSIDEMRELIPAPTPSTASDDRQPARHRDAAALLQAAAFGEARHGARDQAVTAEFGVVVRSLGDTVAYLAAVARELGTVVARLHGVESRGKSAGTRRPPSKRARANK